ncbi:MAG: Hsp20 family protein [Promethearchaeota archaeon]
MSGNEYYDEEDEEDEEAEEDKEEKNEKKDWLTWTKEPKWDKLFGIDFGKDFEMPDLEKIIKQIMKQFNLPIDKESSDDPIVWGFSMSMGPDKKPRIKPFGSLNSKIKNNKISPKHREQLFDIIDGDKEITIIIEIIGVKESDIFLKPTKKSLKISIDTSEQKYFNEIALPNEVTSEITSAQYQNGILEVKLKKKYPKE